MRHAIRAGIAGTLLALTSGVAIAEQPTLTVRAADQAVATEIADRLGAALATPARADSGAACAVRCLDIDLDVEARHATVRWLAADGVTHERALALGPFQAVWAADLALLAENLIRDQTADILASLAPAPSPAAAPVVPAAPPPPAETRPPRRAVPRPHRALAAGLVPYVSTDLGAVGAVAHTASLDLVVGLSGGSRAWSMAGVVDVERGAAHGTQLAGAVAVAERVRGLQVAGAAAVGGDVRGVQLAGGVTVASDARGLQLGGGAAVTGELVGAQVAPLTVAARTHGVQLGVVNIGGDVRGVQLGIINIARRGRDAVPIGLLSVVGDGVTVAEAALGSDASLTASVRHGSRHVQTIFELGAHLDTTRPGGVRVDDAWSAGLGLALPLMTGRHGLELVAVARHLRFLDGPTPAGSLLVQARLAATHTLGPVALALALGVNVYARSSGGDAFVAGWGAALERESGGAGARLWPSLSLGVRR
jgi:hypothetical protein